jgi:hypothetical protein
MATHGTKTPSTPLGKATDTLVHFARLCRTTWKRPGAVNYTVSRNMTLQEYAQPFVSKGTCSDVRELSATPRAARYEDRFQP